MCILSICLTTGIHKGKDCHLVHSDLLVEAIEGDAGIQGGQAGGCQLHSYDPVSPGSSCQGVEPHARSHVQQHLSKQQAHFLSLPAKAILAH